jgi:hypothetical protein
MQITDLLGTPVGALEPNRFGANPADLVHLVGHFQKVMKARDNVSPQFRRLLSLGPIFVCVIVGYLAAIVISGLYWTGLLKYHLLLPVGLTLGALSLAIGAVAMGAYIRLTHQLSSSEILSYELFHPIHGVSEIEEVER